MLPPKSRARLARPAAAPLAVRGDPGVSDPGSVEAETSADFIVLDADPIEDISSSREISSVFPGGTMVDWEGLSREHLGAGSA